jgi:hypothetical protein
MGISYHNAKMLCRSRRDGASFEQTAMVGHQSLCLCPAELESFLAEFPQIDQPATKYAFGKYSDDFFRDILGAASVSAIDVSDYEGAELIHDLNRPVPSEWHGRFDAVVDGGTLEHVFNIPTAFANLMQVVKVGGRVFVTSPANNLCGHGFYQFSPEFMYRVFCPENGFQIQQAIIVEGRFPSFELAPARRAFHVVDPAAVSSRVMLTSGRPAYLMVEALKISDVVLFPPYPQQSDYVVEWDRSQTRSGTRGTLRGIKAMLPHRLGDNLHGYYQRWKHSFANRNFYRRLRD